MRDFKFFQQKKTYHDDSLTFRHFDARPRRYLGCEIGQPKPMSLPTGLLYYMDFIPSVDAVDNNRIPEITSVLRSTAVVASTLPINSYREFLDDNRGNYIFIHDWKRADEESFRLFENHPITDFDVPLIMRCAIK